MQIIEVRNDILKLAYSPFQNGVLLSDFLLISEGAKSILAQVIGIESSQEKDINIATLKGCLSVDDTGKINSYIGFSPSTNAEISPVTQEQVISMLNSDENSVVWGYLSQHDNVLFKTEQELLKNKPLILMDDYANYNVIANNIVFSNSKFGEKTVLVDFDGSLKIDNAFYIKLGEDLKLPLSYTTLNYIYENDIKAESLATQAVVQDIIIELQEYIVTLEEGFLPFSTIKNVIYSQYEENKIPELMLFKNKFVKYAQQNIFAENSEDFNFINESINSNDIIVIDATELEPIWHRLLLNFLSKEINTKCYFITKLENDNSNKKSILDIYNNREIYPILVSNYSHEFLNVMKSIAKNLILFPPIKAINDFSTYSSFMNKLRRDEYVVCGEDTLYLSFLVRLTYINTNMSPEYIEQEIQKDVDKLYRAGATRQTQTVEQTSQEFSEPIQYQEENTELHQTEIECSNTNTNTDIDINTDNDEDLTEDDLDFLDEMEENITANSDAEVQTQSQHEFHDETTEEFLATEEDLDELEYVDESENEIQNIEETQPIITEIETEENLNVEETNEDKTESTAEIEQPDTILDPVTTPDPIEEYSFSETEENDNTELIANQIESEPEEEPVIEQAQPIPVYSVPELDYEENIEFKEGNFVYHEKYGKGVIEKILTYGNKTLCTIEFEELGRRLLDPNISGLKQI